MHTDLHFPPCGKRGQGSSAGTIVLPPCRVSSSLARRNISPLIHPKETDIPEFLVQQEQINLAQREVGWPCLRPHTWSSTQTGMHKEPSWIHGDPLWECSSHLGFASAYLSLGSGQLAELAVKRIQFLLHLYHSLLLHLFVFWGWNIDLTWLLTAFGYKRRKALHWEVQAVSAQSVLPCHRHQLSWKCWLNKPELPAALSSKYWQTSSHTL